MRRTGLVICFTCVSCASESGDFTLSADWLDGGIEWAITNESNVGACVVSALPALDMSNPTGVEYSEDVYRFYTEQSTLVVSRTRGSWTEADAAIAAANGGERRPVGWEYLPAGARHSRWADMTDTPLEQGIEGVVFELEFLSPCTRFDLVRSMTWHLRAPMRDIPSGKLRATVKEVPSARQPKTR